MTDPGRREIITIDFMANGSCCEESSFAYGDDYWDTYKYGTYEIKPVDKSVIITFKKANESHGWMVSTGAPDNIEPQTLVLSI